MIINQDNAFINITNEMTFHYLISEQHKIYYINLYFEAKDSGQNIFFKNKTELLAVINKLKLNGFIFNEFDFERDNHIHSVGFHYNKSFIFTLKTFNNDNKEDVKLKYNNNEFSVDLNTKDCNLFIESLDKKEFQNTLVFNVGNTVLFLPKNISFYYENYVDMNHNKFVFVFTSDTKQTKRIYITIEESEILLKSLKKHYSIINLNNDKNDVFGFQYNELSSLLLKKISGKTTLISYNKYHKNIPFSINYIKENIETLLLKEKVSLF
jgi:hypothetical protein